MSCVVRMGGWTMHSLTHTLCSMVVVLFLIVLCNSQAAGCPMGYYGVQCMKTCSANCMSMDCVNSTGACVGGCKDGWLGSLCDTECDPGFYGSNCSSPCPDNCQDKQCDHASGECTTGCAPGYMGKTCMDACSLGFYGNGCQHNCPVNCAGGSCHHQSGYCLKGCKLEFWGTDCSLYGEFKDVPAPLQGKFYQQLSAESRSVLLFVLMGEYERTLETAQMEIKRGIQQRNELRHLLGSEA